MNIDWNAISAIGQVAGAMGTFAAVVVSLRMARMSAIPVIKVSVNISVPLSQQGTGNPIIIVKATNAGTPPVKLAGSAFTKRRKSDAWMPMEVLKVLPAQISHGESVYYSLDPYQFARTMKSKGFTGKPRFIVSFTDSLGRTHSTKWRFHVDSWAEAQ